MSSSWGFEESRLFEGGMFRLYVLLFSEGVVCICSVKRLRYLVQALCCLNGVGSLNV